MPVVPPTTPGVHSGVERSCGLHWSVPVWLLATGQARVCTTSDNTQRYDGSASRTLPMLHNTFEKPFVDADPRMAGVLMRKARDG